MHLPTHNQNPLARGEQRKGKGENAATQERRAKAKKNNNLLLPRLFSFSLAQL
jgi:hypothetical protein